MFLTAPTPHKEAAKAILDKTNVTREVFAKLLPELQQAAFTVTGVECFDALQRIKEAIASVPGGADWDTAKQQIEDELEPWLDNEIARKRRAELLLRLHGFRAYAATNYRLAEAHRDTFPYRQYISTRDARVRESHAKLHGKVFPADSPFWDNHTPPWAWGCRCESVPLLREEVEEMNGEDANKPPEARRVLPEFLLNRAEQFGEIHVGNGQTVDVRTDRERTGEPTAFEWRPGDIGMPMAKIKERYDAATFKQWEAWAKKTTLPDGRTLWKSFGGKGKATAPKPSPAPAAPAPAPAAPPASGSPVGVPVSAAFPVTLDPVLSRAGALIDAVHGDGNLRASAVFLGSGTNGWFQPATGDIKVGRDGLSPVAQFVHELGHKLDREGVPGGYASVRGLMPEVLDAIRQTAAFKALGRDAKDTAAKYPGISKAKIREHRNYLESDVELWARAYTQYIAEVTRDSEILSHFAARRAGQTDYWSHTQWEAADFAPVKSAITNFLTGLGWITP